ncbi:MAG TPA: sensor histidine kinase [Planctomycetaceae bacterium]|nr:sensor histidine kinase [Planctomycetaceae bacterium]
MRQCGHLFIWEGIETFDGMRPLADLSFCAQPPDFPLLNSTTHSPTCQIFPVSLNCVAMSYRTFKRLLGETSLERKCRFLFGGGLLLLVSGSFYLYYKMTAGLVLDRNLLAGRMMVQPIVQRHHWTYLNLPTRDFRETDDALWDALLPPELDIEANERFLWSLYRADTRDSDKIPSDQADFTAIDQMQANPKLRETYRIVRNETGKREMRYYGAVRASQICLECHYHSTIGTRSVEAGTLLGMAAIVLPLSQNDRSLAWNNAVLLSTAIVTVFLAMTASWAIVRYVIVKPVEHLREVSESISRGQLDRRAEIRTGDEFEELSQAFNRMLRHLVTVQEELRQVNTELDSKVDQLARANLQLYELNNLKNDFMATMTHELRTPLNSILGFSDVLAGAENLTDRQQRYLRNIQTSGKDLLTLINDILDLAKIEAGKMDLHIVEFTVGDLLERLASMMRPLAERKNIELTTECDPGIPVLHQDAGKIQQIVYNLLSNAVKFTPEGGRVQVLALLIPESASESPDDPPRIELVVEDTGVGIPLEDQDSIFEKFRQGNTTPGGQSSTLTREYAGTGLGLSIVRELTKLLGGEVTLHSELGKGSRFAIRLPTVLKSQPRLLADVIARPQESSRSSLTERITPRPPTTSTASSSSS